MASEYQQFSTSLLYKFDCSMCLPLGGKLYLVIAGVCGKPLPPESKYAVPDVVSIGEILRLGDLSDIDRVTRRQMVNKSCTILILLVNKLNNYKSRSH